LAVDKKGGGGPPQAVRLGRGILLFDEDITC